MVHYIADFFASGLREIQAAYPDWFVGIRQNGVVIGLEFDHPEGAKFVMRGSTRTASGRSSRRSIRGCCSSSRASC